jgi:hypothetical protein
LVAQTSKNINANGTHDTTANNSVVVDVPNSYSAADEGKVVSGGSLVGQTSRNISENGTYDTTLNSEVIVNAHTDPVLYKIYDPDYYMDITGLMCTLDGREYYKTYADPAFVAYAYCEGYTRPIIISKTENGATFTSDGNNFTPSQTTIDGETWYICSVGYSMRGNIVSTNGFAKKINDTYETFQLAVEALYAIAAYSKIKQNGNYPIPTGYDGYDAFKVDVPNSYSASDEGKVVSDGALVEQTSRSITSNGTYDTTENNEVFVSVSGGGSDGTFTIPYYTDISSDSVVSAPVYGNYVFTAAQAFGNEKQHWWGANNNYQHWLKITFEEAVIINRIAFSNAWTQGNYKWQSSNVAFQGSNDDSTWTDLLTFTGLTLSENAVEHNVNNNTPYLYYRFLCASTTANYTGLGKIKLYGKNSN